MKTPLLILSIQDLLATTAVVAVTTLLTPLVSPVQAVTLVTNRTALAANDQVVWSSLGKVFSPLSPNPAAFLPNSFTASSQRGLGLNVSIPPASPSITPPFVFETSSPPNGIPTNFADGDYVLLSGLTPGPFPSPGNPGPLSLTFDTPVEGAGTQIAVDDTTNFTASVSAYDNAGNLLGAFQVPATSSVALDNSALFLGVSSDTADISKLVYSSSISDRALGINTISLATVPEPDSVLGILAFCALSTGAALRYQLTASHRPSENHAQKHSTNF